MGTRELPQRLVVFQLLICLGVLNFMFLFAQHVPQHSDDLNGGCLVAAFFTQIPILLVFAFTSYVVCWIGLEVRRQIQFLESALETVQVPVSIKVMAGIYGSSIVFSVVVLVSTWASQNQDQFGTVLDYDGPGNFLCWFGGVSWWVAYFVPYILTVIVCFVYLISMLYYVTTRPKQFQLLPDWLQEDLLACATFCIFELLSWFFAMWTELNTVITTVFTWIFIVLKFAAGLSVIVLFYGKRLPGIIRNRQFFIYQASKVGSDESISECDDSNAVEIVKRQVQVQRKTPLEI